MSVAVIIFIIVATLLAVGTIAYVIVDVILLLRAKQEAEAAVEEAVVIPEPVIVPIHEPEPEPEPIPMFIPFVMPPVVQKIDAVEADEMITDDDAMSVAEVEEGTAGVGFRAYINIGVINDNFEANENVTLAAIKEKKLLPAKVKRIKILADGILDKPLTVKAESFSIQAIKMIELTGGKVVILK